LGYSTEGEAMINNMTVGEVREWYGKKYKAVEYKASRTRKHCSRCDLSLGECTDTGRVDILGYCLLRGDRTQIIFKEVTDD